MIRVTDGGITALVDPKGNFIESLGREGSKGLLGKVALEKKMTFYVRYGNWMLGAAFVFLLAEFFWRYRRRKNVL
jgi:apolipoprotein N-acyltransferase